VMHHRHCLPNLENKATYLVVAIDWGSAGWSGTDLNHSIRAGHKK
ncbi:MAG: hypothetical protein RIR50_988, partial [Pseudomonadota bacterium]